MKRAAKVGAVRIVRTPWRNDSDKSKQKCFYCEKVIEPTLIKCETCGTDHARKTFEQWECSDACHAFGQMLKMSGIHWSSSAAKRWKIHRHGAFCSARCHNEEARLLMEEIPHTEETRKWLAKAKETLRAVESVLSHEQPKPPPSSKTQKAAKSRSAA